MLLSILPVVSGAVIGFVPSYLLERRRERTTLRTRWDSSLFELCSDFASSTRRFRELCLRGGQFDTDALDEEHERLRRLSEQIRLLGSWDVQVASRWIVRHAWAVRHVAEGNDDPRAEEFPGESPLDRMDSGLDFLYLAARRQLRVGDADRLGPREGLPAPRPNMVDRVP